MKQVITLIILVLNYIVCGAQATSLTIDNQTPGWLSSKINYGDQQTIEDLTVTGFINATDCAFIGTLIQSHSLTGSLNLEECEFVNDNGLADNKIPSNVFGFKSSSDTKSLQKLSMPTKIVDYASSWFGEYQYTVQIDSLIIGGPELKSITSKTIPGYKSIVKHLVIREGAESLSIDQDVSSSKPENCISSIQCITVALPSTIKKIDKYCFANSPLQEINLPDNIEEIGEYAFLGCSCFKDKPVFLPKSLKMLYINMFYRALPGRLYIGPNVSKIDNSYYYDYNSGGSWTPSNAGNACVINGEKIDIFIFASTPTWLYFTSGLSNAIIHVPQNCLDAYKSNSDWSKLNIEEFSIPNDIEAQIPEFLYVGDNITLNEGSYGENTIPIIWDDNNNDCVEISNNRLYCRQFGEAVITGSYLFQDSKTDFILKVFEHSNGIQISQRELEINVGETLQMIAQTLPLEKSDGRITWESEDNTVVSISNDGVLTAKKAGVVYITAKSTDGGYSRECRVSVTNKDIPIQSISINPPTKTLTVGDSFQLAVVVLPTNATDCTISWTTTNSNVVSVTTEGLITALSDGCAQIIAATKDGSNLSAICEVTVNKCFVPITDITLNKTTYEGKVSDEFNIAATINPEDASNKVLLWKSSDESVVSVDNLGHVRLLSEGNAIISATATDDSGVYAECVITVSGTSGIQTILADANTYVKIYNLSGFKVYEGVYAKASLAPGYYIIISNGSSIKMVVE